VLFVWSGGDLLGVGDAYTNTNSIPVVARLESLIHAGGTSLYSVGKGAVC